MGSHDFCFDCPYFCAICMGSNGEKTFLINTCDVWVQIALPLKKTIRSIGISFDALFFCVGVTSRFLTAPVGTKPSLPPSTTVYLAQALGCSGFQGARHLRSAYSPPSLGYRESCWHGSRSVTTPPLSLAQPSLALSFSQRRHRFAVLFEKI